MRKAFLILVIGLAISSLSFAERYVGGVAPSFNVAVSKCNETCVYFSFGSPREDIKTNRLGSAYGYAYPIEDDDNPRKLLQSLRYDGYFVDVQNNTECQNSFYETHSHGEISVGTDNVSSECYKLVESTLSDNGFVTDESFNPDPPAEAASGNTVTINHALSVLLLLTSK